MKKIKITFLYYESKVVYVLANVFAYITHKFMNKHHKIYDKWCKLRGEK